MFLFTNRNRDTNVWTGSWAEVGGMNWKVGIDIYTELLLCINRELMRICGDLTRKEIEIRGDICIYIVDSLCCTVETEHNIVKQLYSNKN